MPVAIFTRDPSPALIYSPSGWPWPSSRAGVGLYERWAAWWRVGGAGDELQRVPRAAQGVQRRVRAAAVPAVDRRRRGAGPRHRLRRQVLRPRRPPVLPHRRPRAAAPSGVPVVAVRGGREDDQSGERRRGAARRWELAAVPGRGGDGAAGRRHRPAARVRRGPRHVCSGGEAGRGVLDVLDGEAGADDEDKRGGAARPASAGAVVRPRAVAQPRVTPGARGAAPARHAVHDLRGVRDDDDDDERRRRRREGARAAEPFCLRQMT